MRFNNSPKLFIIFFLCLILLLSSLAACENRPAETAVPSTLTLTPTPELTLPEWAARVCQGQAVPQAADYVNSPGAEHKIYVIGADGLPDPWNENLPDNLKAGSVEELEAVLCLVEADVMESSCGMYVDQMTNLKRELKKGQFIIRLQLVEAKTGEPIASETIFSDNFACPESYQSNDPNITNGIYYGDPVTWEKFWNGYNQIIYQAIVNPTSIPPTPTATLLPPGPPGPSVEDWIVDGEDDFSDPDSWMWELKPGKSIANGVLTWNIQPGQVTYQSEAPAFGSIDYDFYVRVVVRHTGGSASDWYGLAFRMQGDEYQKQLAFLIRDDGNFLIQNTQYYGASPLIRPGEWNTLEVTGFEGQIYLSINGVQIFQFEEDNPYAWGEVGLAVSVEGVDPDSTAVSTFEFDEFEHRYP